MILNIELLGLFMIVSGFIIGLGAVTVIDIHGFLGRKSPYWSEATTRTHKVTKPMIWIGTSLLLLGSLIFYRNDVSIIPKIQMGIISILILNGLFLSFSVSPYLIQREKDGLSRELLPAKWQRRIAVSLVFSDLGWWSSVILFCIYILK